MKHIKYSLLLSVLLLVLIVPGVALAQDYYFSLPKEVVNVYWNEDGTVSVDYVFVFNNLSGSPSIQFVDVGVKNPNFNVNNISADVDGKPVYNFSTSDFQGEGGSGVAVGLGSQSIPPGKTSIVHVFIGEVNRVLYPDDNDSNYASALYAPSYFGSQYVQGTTDLTVTFHLPPGVQPEEPRWHAAPDSFSSEPVAGIDDQGRITYTWHNPQASGSAIYTFGASFPKQYVPASAVVQKSLLETLGISADALITFTLCGGFFAFIVLMIVVGSRSAQHRRLQYLPPKISIEGHGIKRGLTAVEAAILLEEPLDKILTMILFAVVKKGAATVTSRDPLEITYTQPQPEGLQPYEIKFLEAFQQKEKLARRKVMQELMVDLVQAVAQKMKGFSRRETVAYYRDIMTRAWAEVEAANTPEVKSQKYDEVMEWTMLDRDYDQRTRRVFQSGPVFVPIWWPRYDPGFGRGAAGMPVSTSTGGGGSGGGMSMPTLPGAAFAASVVTGPQHFAQSVIGNVTDFTGAITNKTNPPPPPPPASFAVAGAEVVVILVPVPVPAPVALALAPAAAGRGNKMTILKTDRFRSTLTHLKSKIYYLQSPASIQESGLFQYARENGRERNRIHLRVDEDGSGLLIVNANRVMHLNPTAAFMARQALEEISTPQAVRSLTRRYNISKAQAEVDYAQFTETLAELIQSDGACPIHDLNLEVTAPFSTRPSAPYRMDLALTYRCNDDCAHCYNGRPRDYPEISTGLWKNILDRLWDLGIPHVVFTGGEPTLRPDLPELIAHAEQNGQITGLNTNARRLSDKQYVERLVQSGLDHVQITVESHDPAIHDQMVRAHGAWQQTVAGLQNVLDTPLYVMTNTTMLRENSPYMEETLQFLSTLGVPTVGLNALIYSGRGRSVGTGLKENELTPLLDLARHHTAAHDQRLIWYTPTQYCHFDPMQLELGVKGCTAALFNMCIEPDGGVIPCQSYYQQLGKFLTGTWESIWNHELSISLRERRNIPSKCNGCALLTECGGGCPLQFQPDDD